MVLMVSGLKLAMKVNCCSDCARARNLGHVSKPRLFARVSGCSKPP